MSAKTVSKKFPSNPNLVPEIETFIMENLTNLKLTDEQLNSLSLSIAEAASNSIIHGNKQNPDLDVEIIIEKHKNKIVLKFIDQGEGFDPENIPDPTTPENILKDSGRGIHIMKTFLSGLRYEFSSSGTTTILELNL